MDGMQYLKAMAIGVLALTTVSCTRSEEQQQRIAVRKTAIAFYKALETPTPAMERAMGLSGYTAFGYPALVDGSLGWNWGVEKVEGNEAYEARIPFWSKGDSAAGWKKQRRTMLVRVAVDAASPGGWAVTRFKFDDINDLTFVRQVGWWVLSMLLAPMVFFLGLIVLAAGFLWPRVAMVVTFLMAQPLQIYVSYVCFGSGIGAAVAMFVWIVFVKSVSGAAKS